MDEALALMQSVQDLVVEGPRAALLSREVICIGHSHTHAQICTDLMSDCTGLCLAHRAPHEHRWCFVLSSQQRLILVCFPPPPAPPLPGLPPAPHPRRRRVRACVSLSLLDAHLPPHSRARAFCSPLGPRVQGRDLVLTAALMGRQSSVAQQTFDRHRGGRLKTRDKGPAGTAPSVNQSGR